MIERIEVRSVLALGATVNIDEHRSRMLFISLCRLEVVSRDLAIVERGELDLRRRHERVSRKPAYFAEGPARQFPVSKLNEKTSAGALGLANVKPNCEPSGENCMLVTMPNGSFSGTGLSPFKT